MDEQKEFSLVRAGVVMGVGGGLLLGFGLMLLASAIALPHWLRVAQTSPVSLSLPAIVCFLMGAQLVKKARALR